MNLEHIYNLCTQLQQISSTKEKEKFLVDNRCEDFDKFLQWLLDPQIVTGIDKKKLSKDIRTESITYMIHNDLADLLQYIKVFNTGRIEDISSCKAFIKNNKEYEDFLIDVFTKRLKLGVNLKTVNKAYGKGFIHVHEVQLGSGRDKLRLKDGEWFSLSRKLNGIRCTYVDGKMISRQGKEFKGLDHIVNYLNNYVGNGIVIDGELIRKNVDGINDNENFRLTTSLVNGVDGDKNQLELVMFDCLTLDEFYQGKSNIKYQERKALLDQIGINTKLLNANLRPVEVVYQGTDQSEIEKQLAIADSKGWEGLMLNKDAPYECKRTTNLIKIKSFRFSDLRIVGYFEGEGKYAGMLGGVVVDYKGNTVRVGSGFDDDERIELWKNPESLLGRIITVKYKEVSQDSKTGKESLQFPVAFGFRDDKDSVSYE